MRKSKHQRTKSSAFWAHFEASREHPVAKRLDELLEAREGPRGRWLEVGNGRQLAKGRDRRTNASLVQDPLLQAVDEPLGVKANPDASWECCPG